MFLILYSVCILAKVLFIEIIKFVDLSSKEGGGGWRARGILSCGSESVDW